MKQGFKYKKGELRFYKPTKKRLRNLNSLAIEHILEQNKWLIKENDKTFIDDFIADGSEIKPYEIEPQLIKVVSEEQALLFRWVKLHWSIPISAGYGRRLRYLVKEQSDKIYKQGKSLNTLVVIDEAHRLAPAQTENEDLKAVRLSLVDAVRTTRKSGLGWMFISQTLSSLDSEILKQLRAYILGFGLGWGYELLTLKGLIGGNKEAIRLYQLFRDPQSSFGDKEYPFMMVGPLSPLSFASIPMFFNAVSYPEEFIELNK